MATQQLTAVQVGDLVNTTLRNLGKPKFTEIYSSLQNHWAMYNLLDKNRVVLDSGYGVQFNLMVNNGQQSAASNIGFGATDVVNIQDNQIQGTADWRMSTMNYATIGPLLSMNREPARIVDYVGEQRIKAMIDLAELMEANFWGNPVTLADTTTPWGVNTWLVKSATQGFNGTVPSGYTTIGGVNPTTYPNWCNYTDGYTAVTRDDFLRKARRMATFVNFKPPVSGIPTPNTGDSYGAYTNYAVVGALEETLEGNNDNLGSDVASQDGKVMFRRAPVNWVSYLDRDTTNPLYYLNWGYLKTYVLQGWWLKQTDIEVMPGQHTVSAHFMDSVYQWITKNRRCHGVMSNGTTYPS